MRQPTHYPKLLSSNHVSGIPERTAQLVVPPACCLHTSLCERLLTLFDMISTFGIPSYIHRNRRSPFMSEELKNFRHSNGIVSRKTTAYNHQWNGRLERLNKTLWRTTVLPAQSKNVPLCQWQTAVPYALYSMRSLLCTPTNSRTPVS